MDFFGIGFGEILLVLVIGLIFLGPGKLIEFAQSLGRLSRNLKRMSSDFTTTITKEMNIQDDDREKTHLKPANTAGKATEPEPPADAGNMPDSKTSDPVAKP